MDEDDNYAIEKLITEIRTVQAPVVKDSYVIFTADKQFRFTGIVFDFENYQNIHSFQRLISRDTDFEAVDSILFYICKIPENAKRISYRLIINGIWTNDPVNPNSVYDREADTYFSYIDINKSETIRTLVSSTTTLSTKETRFVYIGQSGQKIRLAGTFTNWDSFIYELKETKPGLYELYLPLPQGKYFYSYYKGTTSFIDETNPERAFTQDGKIASVLYVN